MDTLLNIRAFLAIADAGSLSGAARKLGVAPSVISKRIGRLEDEMGALLFRRSTRKLAITSLGERYLSRYRVLVRELDDAVSGAKKLVSHLEGHIRVKCPTTVGIAYFGPFLSEFQNKHPNVTIDFVLLDRSLNPCEEGFDIAIGAMPSTFYDVVDVPLCAYPRVICASPDYLSAKGTPEHPGDLTNFDCLSMQAIGQNWTFETGTGDLTVPISSCFSVNDASILRGIACRGHGITVVGKYIVQRELASGQLVALLPDYPVKMLWLKALVPTAKIDRPAVAALVSALRDFTQPIAPWDRDDPTNPA